MDADAVSLDANGELAGVELGLKVLQQSFPLSGARVAYLLLTPASFAFLLDRLPSLHC